MKLRYLLIIFAVSIATPTKTYAWGPAGHAIVGQLAMRFVNDDVRNNILTILGDMSIDTAANWMDIMKSNADYEFMRPWHYIDFPKNQEYQPNNNDNLVNRLIITYNELSHKKTLCSDQIKTDLLILLHLMGDLHMPLHTGYDDDLGGNQQIVQYDTIKTHNLHRFWDEDIIALTGITEEDCMKYVTNISVDTLIKADFVNWMKDSRNLLPVVYDFPDFTLNNNYLFKNKAVVETQLLKAGLRLAFILNKLFYSAVPHLNFNEIKSRYKNGIDVKDASNNIGKKVTVCAFVVGIRLGTSITQISLHEKYPNCPLTIIVFAKSYPNFKPSLEDMYKDKNICVQGVISEYKGKPQIVIESPENIIVQ